MSSSNQQQHKDTQGGGPRVQGRELMDEQQQQEQQIHQNRKRSREEETIVSESSSSDKKTKSVSVSQEKIKTVDGQNSKTHNNDGTTTTTENRQNVNNNNQEDMDKDPQDMSMSDNSVVDLKDDAIDSEEEDDEDVDDDSQRQVVIDWKKKAEFEAEKEQVLSQLDENVKKDFYKIGFSMLDHVYMPGIQLSPYDASHSIRDYWMKMFKKSRRKKRPMSRLVYWYGTAFDGDPYSFQEHSSIVPYEEGVKRNMHILPANIQKKKEKNRKLFKVEALLDRALTLMESDLEKKPEERWEKDFYEEYELPNDSTDDDDDDNKPKEQSIRKQKVGYNESLPNESGKTSKETSKASKKEKPPVSKESKSDEHISRGASTTTSSKTDSSANLKPTEGKEKKTNPLPIECEHIFLPLIQSFEKACTNKDAIQAKNILMEMMKNTHAITLKFLKDSGLGVFIKSRIKRSFRSNEELKNARKEFNQRLEAHIQELELHPASRENENENDEVGTHDISEVGAEDMNQEENESNYPTLLLNTEAHSRSDHEREETSAYERDIVLHTLNSQIKDDFRKLGFVKLDGFFIPVIQLSPYDISCGRVRDKWLSLFCNNIVEGKDEILPRIVHWYGSYEIKGGQAAFSLVRKSDIIDFDDGKKKGYLETPIDVQEKLDRKDALTPMDKMVLGGIRLVKQAATFTRERRWCVNEFLEL